MSVSSRQSIVFVWPLKTYFSGSPGTSFSAYRSSSSDRPEVMPQATVSLWPMAMTGAPAAVTPRTFRPGAWTSSSTNSSGIE